MAKPKITYGGGPTTLTFNQFPAYQQIYTKSVTYTANAPEADTNSTTEYIQNHIYIYDFAVIKCQAVLEADIDSFHTWFDAIKDGTQFTYFPDAAVAGTSYTVMIDDGYIFEPENISGLFYFDIALRIIS